MFCLLGAYLKSRPIYWPILLVPILGDNHLEKNSKYTVITTKTNQPGFHCSISDSIDDSRYLSTYLSYQVDCQFVYSSDYPTMYSKSPFSKGWLVSYPNYNGTYWDI